MVSETVKSLEVKEPYTVQTDMLKNRTHQSYKWIEIALCEDEKHLEEWAKKNLHRTQEYRIKNRY